MPVIGAIFGAIVMGLIYWVMWGGGLAYIDAMLSSREDRRRREANARRRIESGKEAAKAPLRTLTDPREAATVLMCAAARVRGEPTPEQDAVITEQMRDVLGFDTDLQTRLSYCRYAVEQAQTPETTIEELAPLLHKSLEPSEQAELRAMLERVVSLHGGPTERQQRFVDLAMRRVAETR